MFGDLDPDYGEEHSRVPVLKLIDFGEAQEPSDPSAAPKSPAGAETSGDKMDISSSESGESDSAYIAAMEQKREELRKKEIREYDQALDLKEWTENEEHRAELLRQEMAKPDYDGGLDWDGRLYLYVVYLSSPLSLSLSLHVVFYQHAIH